MDNKRVMKLVDRATNLMECRVCRVQHYAVRTSRGRLKPGSWHCDDGCVLPEDGRRNPNKRAAVPPAKLSSHDTY